MKKLLMISAMLLSIVMVADAQAKAAPDCTATVYASTEHVPPSAPRGSLFIIYSIHDTQGGGGGFGGVFNHGGQAGTQAALVAHAQASCQPGGFVHCSTGVQIQNAPGSPISLFPAPVTVWCH